MGGGCSILTLKENEKESLNLIWKDNLIEKKWKVSSSSFSSFSSSSLKGGKKKIIRIFVSSTFTDFYAEREVLVKYIFPRLKEWCDKRNILLVEVDLRWGVPAESTTSIILRSCLGEIERCIEENTIPFFINMLGQRYGWVPTQDIIPIDVFEEFDWKLGSSVTHMEIIRAALRAFNPRALFLFRNHSYIYSLPDSFHSQFVDDNWKSKVSMDLLKEKIHQIYSPTQQVINYDISVNGVDTTTSGLPKVTFKGLDYFGECVYNFLLDAISKAYPSSNDEFDIDNLTSIPLISQSSYSKSLSISPTSIPISSSETSETSPLLIDPVIVKRFLFDTSQSYFCDQRLSNQCYGRDQLLSQILQYCSLSTTTTTTTTTFPSSESLSSQSFLPIPPNTPQTINTTTTDISLDVSIPLLLYTKASGIGLSTILAFAANVLLEQNNNNNNNNNEDKHEQEQEEPKIHTIYHSLQAYEDNFDPINTPINDDDETFLTVSRFVIRSILQYGEYSLVNELFNIISNVEFKRLTHKSAVDYFTRFVTPGGMRPDITSSTPLCILIDSIDKSHSDIISLFPSKLPPHVRVILSTQSDDVFELFQNNFQLSTLTTTTNNNNNVIFVHPLSTEDVKTIITSRMMMYNKRLDSTQLTLLSERSKETNNNLHWLYMACEEVRMFGAFETVTTYIANLPTNLTELFQVYIKRIIQAGAMYQAGYLDLFLKDSLLLLLSSTSGLMENEFITLLSQCKLHHNNNNSNDNGNNKNNNDNNNKLSYSEWSNIFLFLKPLIHLTSPDEYYSNVRYQPRYNFRNYGIKAAVEGYFKNYLGDEFSLTYYYNELFHYFNEPSRDIVRRNEELPFVLVHLKNYTLLYNFIRNGEHFNLPWNKGRYLINSLRCETIVRPFQVNMSNNNNTNNNSPPYPERMCTICSMKCTFNSKRLNRTSCGLCGQIIYSNFRTLNGENSVQLNPTESLIYMCRLHNNKSYLDQNIFKPDCFVCKLPIGSIKMSFYVVMCSYCKGFNGRCGYLKR